MPLGDVFRQDLEPVASTIAKEAQLCAQLAETLQGHWSNEHQKLIAHTMASGVSQILHAQRVLMLEAVEMEMAAALAEA